MAYWNGSWRSRQPKRACAGSRSCKKPATPSASFRIASKLAPEDAEFPFQVRELLYGRKPHLYGVLFTIEGDTVVILHIRHGLLLQ